VLFTWKLADMGDRIPRGRTILPLAAYIVVLALLLSTWRQTGVWKNSRELSEHALKVTKGNYVAHTILGDVLDDQGKSDEAIMQYKEALRIMPTYEAAHNSLGTVLAKQGLFDEAMKSFSASVRLNPMYADGYVNMGLCMVSMGRFQEALRYFQEVQRINPEYPGISGYIEQAFGEIRRMENNKQGF
jgi:Tfp pilus assembly protein PilF